MPGAQHPNPKGGAFQVPECPQGELSVTTGPLIPEYLIATLIVWILISRSPKGMGKETGTYRDNKRAKAEENTLTMPESIPKHP